MWCVPRLTPEFKKRMEDVVELYAKPRTAKEPVICFDEKSKQLLADSRSGKGMQPGRTAVRDYEYVRKGTANIFVAVEPKAGLRFTAVTGRRTRQDYARFLRHLATRYPGAETIHLVQDNLNTHSEKSLVTAFGEREAAAIMRRLRFHFTPKHASWLNMAEIEIGVLSRQCLNRRIPQKQTLQREVRAWEKRSNQSKRTISWSFTAEKAHTVFPTLYKTELTG